VHSHQSQLAIFSLAILSATSSQAHGPAFTGVVAKADTAETVFSNPAGMSRLKGDQMTLNGVLATSFSQFEVDKDQTTVDGGNPRDSEPSVVPSFYHSMQYSDDWYFGYSLNVPTGFGATNGPNWAGRYYSDRFSLVYIALSPAMAYEFNEHFSLGASLRIMYSDATVRTQVNNNLVGNRFDDGKVTVESDGVGYGLSVGALYSFSPDTRIGLNWSSQVNIDVDTKVNFANVRRPAGVVESLQSQDIEVADNVPMTTSFGVYHRLENDWDFTWDVLWVEFSEFGVTDIHLDERTLNAPTGVYNDFFVSTLGMSWPINTKIRGAVGALWVQEPVDDDKRGFGITADEMWGVGAGITYQLDSGNDLAFSVDVIDTGSAPIDTGPSLTRGRVVGKSKDHYSVLMDFTYNWR
jgi:long-chain fatty acid transport protein